MGKKYNFLIFGCLGLVMFASYWMWKANPSRGIAEQPPEAAFDLPLKTKLGEQLVSGEEQAIKDMAGNIGKHMAHHYSDGHAFRAVHAKGHGCVHASFEVFDNIDPRFKAGVFSRPRTFDALIRFSNGDSPPENDSKRESRGMAIKLINVEGEKILPEDDHFKSQDFLMADQPAFFLKDVVDYVKAMNARDGWLIPTKLIFKKFFSKQLAYRDSATPVRDPLNAQYWSKTPYQLGTSEVVKFTAAPCLFQPMIMPPENQENYMKDEMKSHLDREDVCFSFLLQRRMDGPSRDIEMPIEDASKIWSADLSHFQKVAEIRIPKAQAFDTPENEAFCENLSFNPWHSLIEHRPLGNLNRVRKVVYELSSQWRHQHNGAPDH